MDARLLVLVAMILLPVALFAWSRRRRAPRMTPEDARAGFDAVMAGAPLTDHLISAIAMHTALHSRHVEGVVEQVTSPDLYVVRADDGAVFRAARAKALWQRNTVPQPGERVALLATEGSDRALLVRVDAAATR